MQVTGKILDLMISSSYKYHIACLKPSIFTQFREEGIAGLWKGLGPNVARNAIINAAELASYDQVKQSLLATGVFTDNIVTHILSGLGAGFFAVCLGSPVDVVKSRVMGETPGDWNFDIC
jgi:solute carrier family 25 uncoupling protein 8/9